jgi:hypothetical protein
MSAEQCVLIEASNQTKRLKLDEMKANLEAIRSKIEEETIVKKKQLREQQASFEMEQHANKADESKALELAKLKEQLIQDNKNYQDEVDSQRKAGKKQVEELKAEAKVWSQKRKEELKNFQEKLNLTKQREASRTAALADKIRKLEQDHSNAKKALAKSVLLLYTYI